MQNVRVIFWLFVVYLTRSAGTLSQADRYEVVRPHRLLGRQRRTPGGHQVRAPSLHHILATAHIIFTSCNCDTALN